MIQNIKNIISIEIVINVVNSSIIPVFAAETNKNLSVSQAALAYNNTENNYITTQKGQTYTGKKVLTLDKAIEAAINNSDKLTLKSKEIKMYEDKMNLQEKTDDYYKSIGQPIYDYPYDKLELQKDQTEQSKDFIED